MPSSCLVPSPIPSPPSQKGGGQDGCSFPSSPTSPQDDYVSLVIGFVGLLNTEKSEQEPVVDVKTLERFCTGNVVVHDARCRPLNPKPQSAKNGSEATGPTAFVGLDGALSYFKQLAVLKRRCVTVLSVGVDGSNVRAVVRAAGSHDRTMFGIPPTGKRVVVDGEILCAFCETAGRICEASISWDAVGLVKQLMMGGGTCPPATFV